MSIEQKFDVEFVTALALREKQIQQSYRPIIGIHKWFARRPGTVFRSLLLSEFNGLGKLKDEYWQSHKLKGVIADPFMGGGTPIIEANRLGFHVIGADINPMAYWIVRQSLAPLNLSEFRNIAVQVISDVENIIKPLYQTRCVKCGKFAEVKYFIWVKTARCPSCGRSNDLFPNYRLAKSVRHPKNVLICSTCGCLNEFDQVPTKTNPAACVECTSHVFIEGPAKRNKIRCHNCNYKFRYPAQTDNKAPDHRMWAIEYHCSSCKPTHKGRFFKRPDGRDLDCLEDANEMLSQVADSVIPTNEIPVGDETTRLHRWGYRYYREMFSERQLLGLNTLLQRILQVKQTPYRHALLTVFSDFLRYQNMLCRYDAYALKCQDIFSVHGFPVGLVQCENNLLGIPKIGSGSYRHFVEKYSRAKKYCDAPFEVRKNKKRKKIFRLKDEKIAARIVKRFPDGTIPQAHLVASTATDVPLKPCSLDGVFTDPPYFDNVQYAELMDFCFTWLRLGLRQDLEEFKGNSTRSPNELTVNVTLDRGVNQFTAGLSSIFCHYAAALKQDAPFVFTYHHNNINAYLPIVVAILDAQLRCTATLPVAAEMNASIHIAGTKSSILDTIFVCRKTDNNIHDSIAKFNANTLQNLLKDDAIQVVAGGVKITEGDLRCLAFGHISRFAINCLGPKWHTQNNLDQKILDSDKAITQIVQSANLETLIKQLHDTLKKYTPQETVNEKTI